MWSQALDTGLKTNWFTSLHEVWPWAVPFGRVRQLWLFTDYFFCLLLRSTHTAEPIVLTPRTQTAQDVPPWGAISQNHVLQKQRQKEKCLFFVKGPLTHTCRNAAVIWSLSFFSLTHCTELCSAMTTECKMLMGFPDLLFIHPSLHYSFILQHAHTCADVHSLHVCASMHALSSLFTG